MNNLKFDKGFHECLDHWVVYPPSGKKYVYGYVFAEPNGFKNLFGGEFKLKKGTIKNTPSQSSSAIMNEIHIDFGSGPFEIMSDDLREQLGLQMIPDLVNELMNSLDTVSQLVIKGYHFNHMGLSKLAIPYLEHAYELKPESNKVVFELTYSLNANERFEEAIDILKEATLSDSASALLFRELGYTYIKLNQLDSAELTYKQGMLISNENSEKSEMAINMAQAYFKVNNKIKFDEWAELTREFAKPNSRFLEYLKEFEKELNE